MKKILAFLSAIMCICVLAGCAGTPVIYHSECDCPSDGDDTNGGDDTLSEGELKTGLALIASVKNSASATASANGKADYDITMVAVLVDGNGVIKGCIIDSLGASIEFSNAGEIAAELAKELKTKNELGADYGMMPAGTWKDQAKALADFAVGRTVTQLKNGAIDETGKAPAGSELASSATIYLGGYVSAIEKAVSNAKALGAKVGDELKLASLSSFNKNDSKNASSDASGNAQLDMDVTALTMKDGVITSCVIDSVQAKVGFDASGAVTSNTSDPVKTKNELGANYGMVSWGGAKSEWNEQAASFAKYVTGKTPAQVMGIAVDSTTKPTEADLVSSVTISIGGFKALIDKAAK